MAVLSNDERKVLRRQLLVLNSKAWGVATGLLLGLTLLLATLFLVFKGGDDVGF